MPGNVSDYLEAAAPEKAYGQCHGRHRFSGYYGISVWYLGMVLPKLGKGICITPDFEQAILEGDFKASGHFTAACVLFHSVRLLLDRRLRELLHKIRQYQKTQKK